VSVRVDRNSDEPEEGSMTVPGDTNVEENPPPRDWAAAVETPEADRRDQDLPVVGDPDPDPETVVHRSHPLVREPTPLETASEFDAVDQAIEVPYDDEDR
jgi:hypothetical protein